MCIELCCRTNPCRKPTFAIINYLSLFAPLPQSFGLSLSLTKLSFNFSEIVRENLRRVNKVTGSTGMVCTCSGRRSALLSATTATNVLTFLLLCLSIGSVRKVWNPLPNATHYLTAVAPYPDELHFLKCTGLSKEGCCEVLEGKPVWTKVERNAAGLEVAPPRWWRCISSSFLIFSFHVYYRQSTREKYRCGRVNTCICFGVFLVRLSYIYDSYVITYPIVQALAEISQAV